MASPDPTAASAADSAVCLAGKTFRASGCRLLEDEEVTLGSDAGTAAVIVLRATAVPASSELSSEPLTSEALTSEPVTSAVLPMRCSTDRCAVDPGVPTGSVTFDGAAGATTERCNLADGAGFRPTVALGRLGPSLASPRPGPTGLALLTVRSSRSSRSSVERVIDAAEALSAIAPATARWVEDAAVRAIRAIEP
jgi:hypothetical protein